jgi:hypothetical protein
MKVAQLTNQKYHFRQLKQAQMVFSTLRRVVRLRQKEEVKKITDILLKLFRGIVND